MVSRSNLPSAFSSRSTPVTILITLYEFVVAHGSTGSATVGSSSVPLLAMQSLTSPCTGTTAPPSVVVAVVGPTPSAAVGSVFAVALLVKYRPRSRRHRPERA